MCRKLQMLASRSQLRRQFVCNTTGKHGSSSVLTTTHPGCLTSCLHCWMDNLNRLIGIRLHHSLIKHNYWYVAFINYIRRVLIKFCKLSIPSEPNYGPHLLKPNDVNVFFAAQAIRVGMGGWNCVCGFETHAEIKTRLSGKQQKNCSQVALHDRGGTSRSRFNISIFVKGSWFSCYNTDKSGFSTVPSCLAGQKICLQKDLLCNVTNAPKTLHWTGGPSACDESFIFFGPI